jgi:hypothetical protein
MGVQLSGHPGTQLSKFRIARDGGNWPSVVWGLGWEIDDLREMPITVRNRLVPPNHSPLSPEVAVRARLAHIHDASYGLDRALAPPAPRRPNRYRVVPRPSLAARYAAGHPMPLAVKTFLQSVGKSCERASAPAAFQRTARRLGFAKPWGFGALC